VSATKKMSMKFTKFELVMLINSLHQFLSEDLPLEVEMDYKELLNRINNTKNSLEKE